MLDIDQWLDALETLYDDYGYLIVLLGALGENTAVVGLFLPGGTLALLGGFYAQQGTLHLAWVIGCAWLGTVLGYHIDYLIGRLLLARLLRQWGGTWLGRRLRLTARLRWGRRFLARHGGKAILLSHVVGHIRSFVALSAGAAPMRYRRFLAYELIAALVWNTGFCLLGYVAGTQREQLVQLVERSSWVLLAVFVALLIGWRWMRRGQARHQRRRPSHTASLR